MSVSHSKSHTKSAVTLSEAVDVALTLIANARDSLPLENGLVEDDRQLAIKLQVVPVEAIAQSASILETEGHRFPALDAKLLKDAVEYEQVMSRVLVRLADFSAKIEASILQRRKPAASQTLALYAILKGHARVDGSLRGATKSLAPLVNTRKHPHRTKKPANGAQAKNASAPPPAPSPDVISPEASKVTPPEETSPGANAPSAAPR